jgi:acyl-CoA synthetase (AMP-forming)/AMP-acid ligase II
MFGSPALLHTLGRYAQAHQTRLPTLRRVISAGAPVSPEVMERILGMMEEGELHTPYGATESLPVSSISASEVLSETRQRTEAGLGTCVGRPADGVEVRIIRITDQPIDRWDTQLEVPPGRIGEITVGGPMVSWEYHNRPEQTGLAKIRDGDRVLHRMGDVGYFDNKGRLWYCGRKSHRVETDSGVLFTDPCEAPFNNHPEVFRSALVGVKKGGKTRPIVIVELEKGVKADRGRLTAELREIAARHRHTESIETFLFHSGFPVDVRHNAKIGREHLALWAAEQLRGKR